MTIRYGKQAGAGIAFFALFAAAMIFEPGRDWLSPQSVHAQVKPSPWTAIGASGTVDESSIGSFGFNNASAGYASTTGSTAALQFRYNVTNTYDNSTLGANIPGWTTLELGAVAPGGSVVSASLYRVTRCTGARTLICSARVLQSTSAICKTCTFTNTTVNFTADLYYVDVTVDRAATAELPAVHTLRIF